MADEKKAEDFFAPPPNISRAEAFRTFIWNSKTKEFLGRTAKSWVQIIFFYVILYAFLAGFFSVLLIIFYQTVDSTQPKWQLKDSLISNNPGMGYRPSHQDPEANTISFTVSDPKTWEETYAKNLDTFLQTVYRENDGAQVDCNGEAAPAGKSCKFDLSLLGPKCSSGSFGYNEGKPCILLKMNKLFGWQPEPYNRSEIENSAIPEKIKEEIVKQFDQDPVAASKTVWVSCEGESDADKQVFSTDVIANYSQPGFPITSFYPFKNQEAYESPLVALQLDFRGADAKLKIACRLWARNIVFDRQRRLGSTAFEIDIKHQASN